MNSSMLFSEWAESSVPFPTPQRIPSIPLAADMPELSLDGGEDAQGGNDSNESDKTQLNKRRMRLFEEKMERMSKQVHEERVVEVERRRSRIQSDFMHTKSRVHTILLYLENQEARRVTDLN